MNNHEEAFIKAFVEPSRQERFLLLLGNERKRRKFIAEFDHLRPRFLAAKYVKPISGAASLPEAMYDTLKKLGAPDRCWAIGGRFDGQELELLEALRDSGDGFVLSCISGKLAFLKSEDEELILQR